MPWLCGTLTSHPMELLVVIGFNLVMLILIDVSLIGFRFALRASVAG